MFDRGEKQVPNQNDARADANRRIGDIKGGPVVRPDVKIQKVNDGAETDPVDDVAQRAPKINPKQTCVAGFFSVISQCVTTAQINRATVTSTHGMAGWSEWNIEKLTPLFHARTKLKNGVISTCSGDFEKCDKTKALPI